jgi:hypothetical protein
MGDEWQYQLRLYLDDALSAAAREDGDDPALAPLSAVLRKHQAALKCQYDAFAEYVSEAERQKPEDYPLYAWTKATIEDPGKKAKYLKSFTLYVNGEEVYSKAKAEALEADLQPLVDGKAILRLSKHDTNPANNPQIPERYRQ